MKKNIICFFILFVVFGTLYAGPFGLSNGMSLEEVTEACDGQMPRRVENDDRYLIMPSKSHSTFKTYLAWISDDFGLYYIRAISDDISTNKCGIYFARVENDD